MEKFVRTVGGSIWQLGPDGNYHKPNVANFIRRDDKCVVAASDEMYKLIRVGDLVRFKHPDLQIREVGPDFMVEKDCQQFDMIYVPVTDKNGVIRVYSLEAFETCGLWCVI